MGFELIGEIEQVERIAAGAAIREGKRLKRTYGGMRWRKMKGVALVRFPAGLARAELHWYEAHGVGRQELKIKHVLELL